MWLLCVLEFVKMVCHSSQPNDTYVISKCIRFNIRIFHFKFLVNTCQLRTEVEVVDALLRFFCPNAGDNPPGD